MWAELHRRGLTYNGDQKAELAWLEAFTARIGCGTCRQHWRELLTRTPPDLSSPEACFAWTVHAHNAVSRQLGKREWTLDEARAVQGAGLTLELLDRLPRPTLDGIAA
jgi:hypothetical protein